MLLCATFAFAPFPKPYLVDAQVPGSELTHTVPAFRVRLASCMVSISLVHTADARP